MYFSKMNAQGLQGQDDLRAMVKVHNNFPKKMGVDVAQQWLALPVTLGI